MEYLEGQSLRDAMQVRGAYPLHEALAIMYQVLDALSYAHANRVVHRDIKPDNIHILPGGQAKITDFGIARLGEEPALTGDGQVFGTPSYMSPEQIEGKSIDFRTDLFSAGILLYEMLAGRKPFAGDSVISITYAIMQAEPAPLNGIPHGIDQVIRRALNKQPQMRQISADQMKMDLENAERTPTMSFCRRAGQTNLGAAHRCHRYDGIRVHRYKRSGWLRRISAAKYRVLNGSVARNAERIPGWNAGLCASCACPVAESGRGQRRGLAVELERTRAGRAAAPSGSACHIRRRRAYGVEAPQPVHTFTGSAKSVWITAILASKASLPHYRSFARSENGLNLGFGRRADRHRSCPRHYCRAAQLR